MLWASRSSPPETGPAALPGLAEASAPVMTLDEIYRQQFAFVWRSVRRLGVDEASLDDVVQDVFLVVHRKLDTFEGRASLRTWLFRITLRVVSDHRRSLRRRGGESRRSEVTDPDTVADGTRPGPHDELSQAQDVRLLHQLLDELDDGRRTVFILAELEEMTAPEIAEATGENINTVYWRLRTARIDFEKALARHQARQSRRQP
ncbi:MAG: sigma-70 family RNA polymerase sigma factor [Myxococcales bacterium]|nr:MAG: sigma-70 family RNA polymerase sigma factor [Myxococcales bacterium]